MVKLAKYKVDCNGLKSCIRANWFCFKYVFLCKETSRVLKKLLRYLWCQALHKETLPIATILEKKYYNIGVAPNLHFPHLHQTQIYKTHIYTKPRFTQTQIYTAQIYTHPNLHRPKFLGGNQVVSCAATPLTLHVAAATGALSFLN